MVWRSLYLTEFEGAMRRLATALRWASCIVPVWAGSRFPVRANDRGFNSGMLRADGDGRRIRERFGFQIHFFPMFIIIGEIEFFLEFVEGEEQELADEGQVGGIARRHAVLGDGFV